MMYTMRGFTIGFLLLVTGVAAAQDNFIWSVGVGLGQTKLETTSDVVLPSQPPQFTKISESDDLTKIYLTIKPSQYFAAELGVFASGDIQEIVGESIPGAGDGFKVAADSSGFDISVLGILPLANRRVDLFVRLGVQRVEYRFGFRDQVDPSFSDNFKAMIRQNNRIIGIGAQVNFGDRRQYGLRLEANQIDTKDKIEEVTEVLLSFNFGWGNP